MIEIPSNTHKVCCIYKITFSDGCFYIGSTNNLSERISNYKSKFNKSIGAVNKLLGKKWLEFNKCRFDILEITIKQNLLELEQVYIDKYHKDLLCLNRSKSSKSNSGMTNKDFYNKNTHTI